MTTTKHEREKRLEQVEQQLDSVDSSTEWRVQYREAAPDSRPQGMSSDSSDCVLSYDFWGAQQECLDSLNAGENDIVAFLAGYRSGKSVTGARWILTEALRNPGMRFLACGTTYSEAAATTYRTLFEQLPGSRTAIVTSAFSGPEESPIVADYNRAKHRLVLSNDSVIVLGSADKWNRYAGDEYAGIWLDEPSHYGNDLHDLLEMLSTRLTAPVGPKCMFWTLTGNGYNTAWEILEKHVDSDGEELGHTIELVRASVLDNPYIAAEDKQRIQRQFEGGGREEQALHGGFAAAQGLVYAFQRGTHVKPHAQAVDAVASDWRIYGYDAGWADPRVVLEVGKTAYGQLVVLAEFHESESHVEDAIEWLQKKPRGRVYCEHEPADIEKFRNAGIEAVAANKDIDSGIAEVRHRLSMDNQERVGVFVSERCSHLIREFLGYKSEHVGTGAATDHCLDSLRYLCQGMGSNPPRESPMVYSLEIGAGTDTDPRVTVGDTEESTSETEATEYTDIDTGVQRFE